MANFKSFVPYRLSPKTFGFLSEQATDGDLSNYVHSDPIGADWRKVGLTRIGPNEFVRDLDSAGYLMAVQFNERILPAKVRDERTQQLVAEMEQRQGHKCGKKDYVQFREQAEFELLGKAFIRRTVVHVMFIRPGLMLVFTSSVKRADDAVSVIQSMMLDAFDAYDIPRQLVPNSDISTYLTQTASETGTAHSSLEPTDTAVLKGEGKKTIRLKDCGISGHDAQELLKQGYQVHDLGLAFTPEDEDPALTFALNSNFVFRQCVIPNFKTGGEKDSDAADAFHSHAHAVAKIYGKLTELVLTDIDEDEDEL